MGAIKNWGQIKLAGELRFQVVSWEKQTKFLSICVEEFLHGIFCLLDLKRCPRYTTSH
jgi:hypothetical protein